MEELRGTLNTMYMTIIMWFLALMFSSLMFTLSLIYDVVISLIISIGTGILSSIGIFYTGYIILRLKKIAK